MAYPLSTLDVIYAMYKLIILFSELKKINTAHISYEVLDKDI